MTWKRNDFKWDPEQQQGFEQIKPEIVHAVALEPVRIGQDVKSVQPGRMDLPGVSHKKCLERLKDKPWGSEVGDTKDPRHATHCPEKSIWELREGINLLQKRLAPKYGSSWHPDCPVLGWMFKGEVPSTLHATGAMWSKWVALDRTASSNRKSKSQEVIVLWPKGKNFRLSSEEEEEEEVVTCAEEALPHNQIPENEKLYSLFTDSLCHIIGVCQK